VSAATVGTKLPELSLYGDPTFIVSTAIATRDYQDVHHDRDKAQAKGSKDILTTSSPIPVWCSATSPTGQVRTR
jgi:hypothetical protein